MTLREALEQQIADATTKIALWNALLIADASDAPRALQTDYSLDGENYQREAWRAGLEDRIAKAQASILATRKLINSMFPFWLATRQIW